MSRKHKRHDHLPRAAGSSAGTTAPRQDGDGLVPAGAIKVDGEMMAVALPPGKTLISVGLHYYQKSGWVQP